MDEFEIKQQRMRGLMAKNNIDALLLQRVSSFAWATCGAASYVNTAVSFTGTVLLITPTRRYLIANNIETPRLEREEQLAAQGWEFQTRRWDEPSALSELTRGLRIGTDLPHPTALDVSDNVARLRAQLTPEEGERLRVLGRLSADAMNAAIHAVKPGQTEFEIAARLGKEVQVRGAQPIVNLIATDERVFNFRHPLPTAKKLGRYAMLVLGARKWGVTCSMTRLVHFGKISDELRRKADAVARVDATFIAHTRPGKTLGEIFSAATVAYSNTGFADEWHLHHQGGAVGYEPREYLGSPTCVDRVSVGQAFAWNPSIRGTKSEDTILVGESGNEIVTAISNWPTVSIPINGHLISRPTVLKVG
ncbi:MAG: aminopeptidase P family protein [Chloroflexi bacterium]|nr:aminopeptidase P family protein [Chloroflexota bacterium]